MQAFIFPDQILQGRMYLKILLLLSWKMGLAHKLKVMISFIRSNLPDN